MRRELVQEVYDNSESEVDDEEYDWLDAWDQKTNGRRLRKKYSGAYYQFQDVNKVLHAGADGPDFDEDTRCVLTSCSKVYTGMAVMRTMHLKPDDWYPERPMHEFPGWQQWRNFHVLANEDDADSAYKIAPYITIHQLLTHTSGWPFGLNGSRNGIRQVALYFPPGKFFGYSIGHRLLGWMLLDYWRTQPEGASFGNLDDCFRYLVYEPLGLTGTSFIKGKFDRPHSVMGEFFHMEFFDREADTTDDDPADLAMYSSGADMMKTAMVALRRGQLPSGDWYITQQQWNDWAATNKLPGGKLSLALAHWKMKGYKLDFLWRTAVTRTTNAGPFGWSYFGATYHDYEGEGDAGPAIAIGWKGFSSCGLRADYQQGLAFVCMQECMTDPAGRNFGECIHKGKVGDYEIGHVARRLAELDPEEIELYKDETQEPCSCNPCHDHNVLVPDPPCAKNCIQNMLRCGYKCLLPIGVAVIDFHHREEIPDEESDEGPVQQKMGLT